MRRYYYVSFFNWKWNGKLNTQVKHIHIFGKASREKIHKSNDKVGMSRKPKKMTSRHSSVNFNRSVWRWRLHIYVVLYYVFSTISYYNVLLIIMLPVSREKETNSLVVNSERLGMRNNWKHCCSYPEKLDSQHETWRDSNCN